jgi:hypothetical protein
LLPYRVARDPEAALQGQRLVIGASGKMSITEKVLGALVRIGTRYVLPRACVVLLADGMPVNFVGLAA